MPEAVPAIEGSVDPRFGRVRDALATNFSEHDEAGAAVCVRVGGRTVVDLWGGHVDRARRLPWRRDTLVNAYSVGKGVLATLFLASVERGEIDLDAPVARIWPEFAAAGKGDVSVRTLACHQAGLPAVRERMPDDALYDWDAMCRALAEQRPWWEPGTAHGYHVNTYGFLVGELVRRKLGKTLGQVLRERITGPLDADYHLGLTKAEHHRVADTCAPGAAAAPDPQLLARALDAEGTDERAVMRRCTYLNPVGISGLGSVNTAAWREAEIPSTNGQATARAVAAIYAAFLRAGPGRPGGVGRGLFDEATSTQSEGVDRVLDRPSRFGLGFQLAQESRPIGPSKRAFGHYGYGGSLGFAEPDAQIAFGYVMNRPGERWQTPRVQALIDALYDSL